MVLENSFCHEGEGYNCVTSNRKERFLEKVAVVIGAQSGGKNKKQVSEQLQGMALALPVCVRAAMCPRQPVLPTQSFGKHGDEARSRPHCSQCGLDLVILSLCQI